MVCFPVLGEVADCANGTISLCRGDFLDAGLSFASMIPVVGDAIGKGGKVAKGVVENASNIKKGTESLNSCVVTKFKEIETPYGSAKQSKTSVAMAARKQVEEGATLYRGGTMKKSQAAEAQFWSLENPLSPDYASKMGIPPENYHTPDFIESGTLKRGTDFVTRPAPGIGHNVGGGIEVVVPSGGVKLNSFTTLVD